MARILTLDAALGACSAGLIADGAVIAERHGAPDQAASLAASVLAENPAIDLIAVTIGPGSFTGLRSAIALAHGIGIASGSRVVGVTVGAALRHLCPPGRAFWAAIDSKRGRVFLERDGAVGSVDLGALPPVTGKISIAGDAAIAVVARLAARGVDVQLLDGRRPSPAGIALAAERGDTRPPLPLYVDPPEARPGPAGRPPPQ